jgi:hypothetical protein
MKTGLSISCKDYMQGYLQLMNFRIVIHALIHNKRNKDDWVKNVQTAGKNKIL